MLSQTGAASAAQQRDRRAKGRDAWRVPPQNQRWCVAVRAHMDNLKLSGIRPDEVLDQVCVPTTEQLQRSLSLRLSAQRSFPKRPAHPVFPELRVLPERPVLCSLNCGCSLSDLCGLQSLNGMRSVSGALPGWLPRR